jgi:hypothetical protein
MRLLIASLLLLLAGFPALADAPDRLFVRPWMELEPLMRIDPAVVYPIPVPEAEKNLLEEGRKLISGMIYGWSFIYYPGDVSRGVKESFVLSPVAEIPWGSPRLTVLETEQNDTRLWARISYTLNDTEALRRGSWDSNTVPLSTGQGAANLLTESDARRASRESAIKDAIRRGLDVRYVNKPREITGEVILWDDPLTLVSAGFLTTTAKVKVLIRDLVPYGIF